MNQLLSVALGGAAGALLRFFVSSGLYTWLGRGFPYGTLAVNIIGSFLIGLLAEALILQRIAIALEYRAAIIVGLLGAFTTFSTFSLETFYLIEQGHYGKAGLNVVISVAGCLIAVWMGLMSGRTLFFYSGGVIRWLDWIFPYSIVAVNGIGSFLIGTLFAVLGERTGISLEHRAAILIVVVGAFMTFSSLYLVLYLIEEGHSFNAEMATLMSVIIGNSGVCLIFFWAGSLLGKQV